MEENGCIEYNCMTETREHVRLPPSAAKEFYAVGNGRNLGVYEAYT